MAVDNSTKGNSSKAKTPEEKARKKIDKMFDEAGWLVVNRDEFNPQISACVIREGLLEKNNEADYLLLLDGKVIGVLEAKRKETDVNTYEVISQVQRYAERVPTGNYAIHSLPLPISYLSNGECLYYKNLNSDDDDYQDIGRIHTPRELAKILNLENPFAGLKYLKKERLRDCQYEAINNLEQSFRSGKRKALIVLATGAGKTYTACLTAYRFLSQTPMRRILFLVDRNNLGKQAEAEFGSFRMTDNKDEFNKIYTVNRLNGREIPKDSNLVISTIQRLFSFLKGEEVIDTDEEDESLDGSEEKEIILPENPLLPSDFFDCIIIDECHRSIYGNWKSVLDYFSSAYLIGLTATPLPESLAFFDSNQVVNYTLEKSILDGVNVGYRVFRIKTQQSEEGGTIHKGDRKVVERNYDKTIKSEESKTERVYEKNELNRSVIVPDQIRLILETYKNSVYTQLYPEREPNFDYLPKTLIFALDEKHANNIVKIAREVFEREDDDKFVQKITYSAGDSDSLIRDFRKNKDFRIAVTCTLVATGTDVKPLEVLIFMRDVQSQPLYTQMKGRGVRTISDDILRDATPNADSKDEFFLIDAVGVTEHEKTIPKPSEREEAIQSITLKQLFEEISLGKLPDEHLRMLANRLSRIYNKATEEQMNKVTMMMKGYSIIDLASEIFKKLEDDDFPEFIDINEPNLERKELVSPLTTNPLARKELLIILAGFRETLLDAKDKLISADFSQETAQSTIDSFETYCQEHKDEIEALRLIYNNSTKALTYSVLKELKQTLMEVDGNFQIATLWNAYNTLAPEKVNKKSSKHIKDALTDIIQLVRFAFKKTERLESLYPLANRNFSLWEGQVQRELTEQQKDLFKQIVEYIAVNGAYTLDDIKEEDQGLAIKLIQSFEGDKAQLKESLSSLSQFILNIA